MTPTWTDQLLDQLVWHWDNQLRPGLDGLTDDEYFWEPVEGAWNIRPRAEARTAMAGGGGDLVADFEFPAPSPAPVTTIAWRLAHVTIGVYGMRNHSHFGGPPIDYFTAIYPPDAKTALEALDEAHATWVAGVSAFDDDDLARAIGPAEGEWAGYSYAALILHIHREVIHHGAEILLLRDLYRWK